MRTASLALAVIAMSGPAVLLAQTPAVPPPAAPENLSSAIETDRFGALREEADRLKAAWAKVDNDNLDTVDRLLNSRVCQFQRVTGLIDRAKAALDKWYDAEYLYWKNWSAAEEERVQSQKKSLATMEVEKQRALESMESATKDREDLLRRQALLERSKRTEAIRREMDDLINEIKDSEGRLDQAQKRYTEVSAQVQNLETSITARLVEVRQQMRRFEAFGQESSSLYEKKRKEAQENCNLKQPSAGRVALPRRKEPAPKP